MTPEIERAIASANLELGWLTQLADIVAQKIAQTKQQIADLSDPWNDVDKTGATDVTAQVQALWDQGRPMPAGRYLIDATKGLIANRDVTLAPDAVLVTKPNSAPRYYLVTLTQGVTFQGGHLIGDRLAHTYTAGSTHEWGYGIKTADGCSIYETLIEQFTGDGICQAGDRVTINGVASTRNRRQGMSVFDCTGLRVSDSIFANTGTYLTDPAAPNGPCAGVDIEPDSGSVTDAVFDNCTFTGNRAGVLAWLRSGVNGTIGVTLRNCNIANNPNGVWARDAGLGTGTIKLTLSGNAYATPVKTAIKADAGSVITSDGETFTGILSKYAVAQLNGGKATVTGATYK